MSEHKEINMLFVRNCLKALELSLWLIHVYKKNNQHVSGGIVCRQIMHHMESMGMAFYNF